MEKPQNLKPLTEISFSGYAHGQGEQGGHEAWQNAITGDQALWKQVTLFSDLILNGTTCWYSLAVSREYNNICESRVSFKKPKQMFDICKLGPERSDHIRELSVDVPSRLS